jgi:signal transduction histidine kinase/CheY-like chemotaxis protein
MNYNSPNFVQELIFNSLLLLASFLVIILFLLWRAYQSKQRSNHILKVNNKEIEDQNRQIIKAQNEILEKNTELRLAKEKAESASVAKQNFLSNMSHEIRTPLNAVIGFSDILLQENPKKEQLEYLKAIKFSGENLLVLVNDILDITKIEEGKIALEAIDFDIKELMLRIIQLHKNMAREKGLGFITKIDQDIMPLANGDPVRLTQILNNLLTNAIKFTEKGDVVLQVDLIEKNSSKQKLKFKIIDSGIGIPRDQVLRIFERFEQGNSDTTRKFGGSGLGLTITKYLLQLHGSEIMVESTPGKGSEFYFELEYKSGENPGISDKLFIHEYGADELLKNKQVLIVEDNELNLKVAQRFLVKWNTDVDTAINGEEALNMARAKCYDLILMDLQMPVMDGYECIKKIRNEENNKSKLSPVIALTADVMTGEMDSLITDHGFNDFITKPFNPSDLKRKIIKILVPEYHNNSTGKNKP